ncbi:cell division inhibitor SepF [Anaerosphaera aminiphila DSM 21120]|uniref:Cell division protein SepF n=1 Tax=Anaerosphaera aminiphila DSM 21120 TaxID=1120995 RepID=A0A1M5NW57_9FIRM|nr:cell division protein SepF [Anaerosphaera aminiphila]SHG93409.1 cell division inhibitor SepF [Anaerosphaera aminiphila DSM 21120]
MAEMMDKIKKVFGFSDDYDYDDYEDENYEDEINVVERETPTRTVKNRKALDSADMVITVHEPLSYEEAPNIVDDLRDYKSIVLNFEQLDIDVKREIFDFVNGALYALDGKIQKVNKDIFILAPKNVEIDGLKEELKNAGMFPW